jgi:hypothetical protein
MKTGNRQCYEAVVRRLAAHELSSYMSIAKRAEKRAIIPADLRGILKIVGSAVTAG